MEDIEKQVEVFQHFDEKSYSGKFLGYIKKIRSGFFGFSCLLLLLTIVELVAVIFGSAGTTWDDVGSSFMFFALVTFLGYILIFLLQGFSIIIKNNEDEVLERIKQNK